VHILAIAVYGVVGVFQFVPGIRRRRPGRHRRAGRVLVVSGLLVAATGVGMTIFYEPLPNDSAARYTMRLAVGSAIVVSIVLGFAAIRRRDVARHRAWMIRGYAIGQGGGSQAVIFGVWVATAGEPSVVTRALLLGAGWVLNLVVAEWLIHRKDYR